jgi:hypothetical protein
VGDEELGEQEDQDGQEGQENSEHGERPLSTPEERDEREDASGKSESKPRNSPESPYEAPAKEEHGARRRQADCPFPELSRRQNHQATPLLGRQPIRQTFARHA